MMKKGDCALIGFVIGGAVMSMLLIFLFLGTTEQKMLGKAQEAKQVCEATLPRNISCEIVITAVPKTGDQ